MEGHEGAAGELHYGHRLEKAEAGAWECRIGLRREEVRASLLDRVVSFPACKDSSQDTWAQTSAVAELVPGLLLALNEEVLSRPP